MYVLYIYVISALYYTAFEVLTYIQLTSLAARETP